MIFSDEQLNTEFEAHPLAQEPFEGLPENETAHDSHPGLWLAHSRPKWNDSQSAWRSGEFCNLLPIDAAREFEHDAKPYPSPGASILFTEGELPDTVLFVLEGSVKFSMESIDGRHLTVGIAGPGEVLGLAAAVANLPYEVTAVTEGPCQLTSLHRLDFLAFLMRYPAVAQNVGLLLSREYAWVCRQARSRGVRATAGTRLARLLLKWCACGTQTDHGMRIECSLTHQEIGESIGMARKSVARTLRDFAFRDLVAKSGSALLIPSVRALEIYANRHDA